MVKKAQNAPLIGAHMSIAGGLDLAIERGANIGCQTIQIFTKNSNQWAAPPLKEEQITLFLKQQKAFNMPMILAHDSYLINLASPNPDLYKKSHDAFQEEIQRAEALKLYALVFHPGAHLESGEQAGIKQISQSLNKISKNFPNLKLKILLETTAGQGTCIGHRFEHLASILENIKPAKNFGVCFDTQHVFAAGYDLRKNYKKVMQEFDTVIGTKQIQAFHLNDSKKECGSRVDRHEHIGKGLIGLEAFRQLLNDARFQDIPKVLETPKKPDLKEDLENLKTLRSLIS